jgi:hypothetical protein
MQFLCLVHVDRALEAAMTPAEREVFDRQNRECGEWLAKAGRSILFGPLQEPETASLLRTRDGEVSMTDGPYVETKEHLAGFIVFDAPSREAALEIIARCPVHRIGTLELRAPLNPSFASPSDSGN